MTANSSRRLVRYAGPWELPAGQMALREGTSTAARTVDEKLIDGRTALDASVREAAPQLCVALPSQPPIQQWGFQSTLSSAQGAESVGRLADIPRPRHGKVFTLIAQVRAVTRNSLGRQMADLANIIVLVHMAILEQMGMPNFDQNAIDATASPTVTQTTR